MACLARCLVASLSVVVLAVVCCLPSRGEAMGLPRPRTNSFTVAVEGMVWCKSCRYAGYARSKDASPLRDAAAELECQSGDGSSPVSVRNTTDAGGYFLMQVDWQSGPFKSKGCRVKVYAPAPRSPARGCTVAVKPNPNGAALKFRRFVPLSGEVQARYSVGDFTFAPEDPAKC